MTDTETFLEEYKRLETALKTAGHASSVIMYEDELCSEQGDGPETADRLKVCRIIRNYLQHHPDGKKLFVATPAMVKFVSGLADRIEAEREKISDIITRQKAIIYSGTLESAIQTVSRSKIGYAAVVTDDKAYVGILTAEDLLRFFTKCRSLTDNISDIITVNKLSKLSCLENVTTVSPDDPADIIYDSDAIHIIAVKDGKYKGIVR